jgi:fucose permease
MPIPTNPQQPVSRTLLAACCAAFFILGMAGAMVGPAKDAVVEALGMPIERGGLLVSAQFVGATAGVYLGGWLSDRTDMRVVLCGGGLLMALGLVLFGVSSSFALFVVAEAVMGLGMGGWAAGPNIIFAKAGLKRPSVGLNLLNGTWGIGSALGPQLVDSALDQGRLALAYYSAAAVAGLLLPVFWRMPLRLGGSHSAGYARPEGWRPYLPFALMFTAYVGAETGFGAWVYTQLTAAGKAPVTQGALAASLFWAGLTLGRMAAVVLLRHVRERSLLSACAMILAVGALTMVLFPQATSWAVVVSLIIGLGCGPIFPTTYGWVVRSVPATSGATLATLQAVGTFGAVLVPPVQGYVGAGKDGGMIVVAALGAALAWLFARAARKPRAQPRAA